MSTTYTDKHIKRAKKLHTEIGLSLTEISRRMEIPRTTLIGWRDQGSWVRFIPEPEMDPVDSKTIEIERLEASIASQRLALSRQRSLHKSLARRYDELQARLGILEEAGPPKVRAIRTRQGSSGSEGTVVAIASDWHVEEEVKSDQVNGLNEFNRKICDRRVSLFFDRVTRLTRLFKQDLSIGTIVLGLLGDFITNHLHEEHAESNTALPVDAIIIAQSYIASGIKHLLANTDCNIVLPCHSGNHGRFTKKIHVSTEYGHSLEYLMYRNLEKFFEDEDRVEFIIPRSYFSYVDVYGKVLRFHHGHMVRYQGGVGGIYIPVNKAIAQWNKAKHADVDFFGHFHQLKDGGNFVSNGSLIGYSAYGISIKGDFERPQQIFSVFDSKRGRTFTCPILVD